MTDNQAEQILDEFDDESEDSDKKQIELTNISTVGGGVFVLPRVSEQEERVVGLFGRRLFIEDDNGVILDVNISLTDLIWLVRTMTNVLHGDVEIARRMSSLNHSGRDEVKPIIIEDLKRSSAKLLKVAEIVEAFTFERSAKAEPEE